MNAEDQNKMHNVLEQNLFNYLNHWMEKALEAEPSFNQLRELLLSVCRTLGDIELHLLKEVDTLDQDSEQAKRVLKLRREVQVAS